MVYGQYNQEFTYEKLLGNALWKEALEWIQNNARNMSDGEHNIKDRDMYANIQSLATISKSEGVFETHKQYIDIHYCLEGGETIGYAPIGNLEEKTEFDAEKDYQLYNSVPQYSLCTLQQDSFAIFFPGELHMPKLQDGIHEHIKKVVIKIKADLLI